MTWILWTGVDYVISQVSEALALEIKKHNNNKTVGYIDKLAMMMKTKKMKTKTKTKTTINKNNIKCTKH